MAAALPGVTPIRDAERESRIERARRLMIQNKIGAIVLEPGTSMLDSVSAWLTEKHVLLVLDNCEQVREAAAEIGLLLDGCREVSVLATSRIPLHLIREREFMVDPLPVPDLEQLPPFDQLSQYDAVALFIARVS